MFATPGSTVLTFDCASGNSAVAAVLAGLNCISIATDKSMVLLCILQLMAGVHANHYNNMLGGRDGTADEKAHRRTKRH